MSRCVPDFTQPIASKSFNIAKSLLQANNARQNFVMITDRSIFDDEQLGLVKSAALIFLLIVVSYFFISKKTGFIPYQFQRYHNKRYSYLSFRTIRI
jgi:hypothetical protein